MPRLNTTLRSPTAAARRPKASFSSVSALLCATGWVFAACSSPPPAATEAEDPGVALGFDKGQLVKFTGVETTLSATTTPAGKAVTVTCAAMPGSVAVPHPLFKSTPNVDVVMDGASLTAKRAGSYSIACVLGSQANAIADLTPATLIVTAASATTIVTTVTPAKVAAGDSADIGCSGKDAFGNDVGKGENTWTATVVAAEIGAITALKIEGHKAGKGAVSCALPGSPDAKVTSADLEVVPGKVAKTTATVAPASLEAGDATAEVTCAAVDAFDNPIAGAKMSIDAPADVKVDGTKVSSHKAGTYEIKCGNVDAKEAVAASLEIKPGAPVSWVLVGKPKKPSYLIDDTMQLFGTGKDKYDNEIKNMAVVQPAVYEPKVGITPNANGKSYTFNADGIYTFTGLATDFPSLPAATLTVTVDSTGPTVEITTPKRGETRDGNALVTVKGICKDKISKVKGLIVNKQPMDLDKDGNFKLDIPSAQGMNPIIWEALDEWDNKSTGVQTYYYSTKWYPEDEKKPAEAYVPEGIGIWMSQVVLDAGKPHDHKKLKDLASVAEIIIGTLDLKALLSSGALYESVKPFTGIEKVTISLKSLTFGDPKINDGYPDVNVKALKGAIHFGGKVYNFVLTLNLNVEFSKILGFGLPPFSEDVIVHIDDVQLDTDLFLSQDATGKIVSKAKNTVFVLGKYDVKFKGAGLLDAVFNYVSGLINQYVQGTLSKVISLTLETLINQQFGAIIGQQLEKLAINQDLPLKPFIGTGPEVKLHLASKIGSLDILETGSQPGGIILGLDGSFTSPKKVPAVVLGSIGRAACFVQGKKEQFNPTLKYAFELGMADDVINELLFSVWNGGLTNLTIGAADLGTIDLTKYGVADVSIETDFLLPPILNTCIDGKGQLKLQIGDLQMHAKLNFSGTPVDITMFVTVQASAEIKAVVDPKTGEKAIGFTLKGVDFVEMEVSKINAEAAGLQDLFVTLVKTVMVPKLIETLGGGLGAFPLPAIDLSSFSPSIPKGTTLSLEVQVIENLTGYTYLRGKVK